MRYRARFKVKESDNQVLVVRVISGPIIVLVQKIVWNLFIKTFWSAEKGNWYAGDVLKTGIGGYDSNYVPQFLGSRCKCGYRKAIFC